MKNSYQAQKIIGKVIKEKPKSRWLFLTFSTRNAIDGKTLEKALKVNYDPIVNIKTIKK